jgi:hypothetical protein
MLPVRQAHGSLVAGGVLADRDLLHVAVRESQRERGLLMNSGGDRANVGIVPKDTDEVRVFVFPYIAVNPQPNPG